MVGARERGEERVELQVVLPTQLLPSLGEHAVEIPPRAVRKTTARRTARRAAPAAAAEQEWRALE